MPEESTASFAVDPKLQQMVWSLYTSMSKRLQIKQAPKILFSQNAANAAKPFGLTAFYNQHERYIKVYITNRHTTDILRSFAHELIHHWQNENGKLPAGHHDPTHYAQKNPQLRKCEMEAYLYGNIMFRDWQDENRFGPLSETVTISEIRQLIRERFEEAIRKKVKKDPSVGRWSSMFDKPAPGQSYADYVRRLGDERMAQNKYMSIGFSDDDSDHYCWYWDEKRKKIITARGRSHGENFGDEAYKHFRGRYDITTREISLAIPDPHLARERGETQDWTGDIKKDVPLELLKALQHKFPKSKIEYFASSV